MVVEKITIVTEMIDKASGKLKKIGETTRELNRFQGIQVDTTKKLNQQTGKYDTIIRKTTRGVKSFNFAWLSVMFAGMALNRVFGGLIKSQLQLFGIMDLFSATLTLVMLPVMELLLPLFFKLSEIFMGLPDGVKLAIGVFIILGFVFGLILLIVGQVMLAFGGFALLFTSLSPAMIASIIGVIVVIVGITIALIGVGLIIFGIIKIIRNWGKNWGEVAKGIVMVLGGIVLAIVGVMLALGTLALLPAVIIALIVAAVIAFTFFLVKNWDQVKDSFIIAWTIMKNVFFSVWNAIVSYFESSINNFIKGINILIGAINKIPGISIPLIPKVDFGRFKAQLEDVGALRDKLALQREERARAREAIAVEKAVEKKEGGGFLGGLIPDKFKGMVLGASTGEVKQEVNINNNNTFNISDKEEMEKMIDANNTKLVEDIKRQIAP